MSTLFSANSQGWRQLIITVVIIAILLIAQPWIWGYVKTEAESLHARRTQEQQLNELTERLNGIEARHRDLAPQLDQLAIVFPRAGSTSQVVDRLEQVADRLHVELSLENIGTDAAPVVPKKTNPLVPTVVSVVVRGAATNLLQYIDAVEHIQELAVIQSWDLTVVPNQPTIPSTEPAPFTLYMLTMNIIFYLQP